MPLDGSNYARTDEKALVSGHGRALVAVPDHWLRIWSTDYSDLTQWNQAAVNIPSKGLGGGVSKEKTVGAGAKDARRPTGTGVQRCGQISPFRMQNLKKRKSYP